jgi:hypothetical protein
MKQQNIQHKINRRPRKNLIFDDPLNRVYLLVAFAIPCSNKEYQTIKGQFSYHNKKYTKKQHPNHK